MTVFAPIVDQASPVGIELVASIPGGLARERSLKTALCSVRLRGKWFRSCPLVWRLILQAVDHDDLAWLPHVPQPALTARDVVGIVREVCGSGTRARLILGKAAGFTLVSFTSSASSGNAGLALFLLAWAHGELPARIAAIWGEFGAAAQPERAA